MMVYGGWCCAHRLILVETDVVEVFTTCDYSFSCRSPSFNSHEPEPYLGREIPLIPHPPRLVRETQHSRNLAQIDCDIHDLEVEPRICVLVRILKSVQLPIQLVCGSFRGGLIV
jgi:hypothetical protein